METQEYIPAANISSGIASTVEEKTITKPPKPFTASPAPLPIFDIRMATVVRQQHESFMARYQEFLQRNIQERHMARTQVQARLSLVAEVFKSAGVISSSQDVDIVRYPQSIVLRPAFGDYPVYLLNDCEAVIAACGTVVGQDPFTARLMVASQTGKESFYLRAVGVLEDGFDWTAFASSLLSEMHKMAYDQERALADIFERVV